MTFSHHQLSAEGHVSHLSKAFGYVTHDYHIKVHISFQTAALLVK